MLRGIRRVPLASTTTQFSHFVRPFSVSLAARMTSISDAIIHDHKELKDYYGKIMNAGDSDTKTRWRNQFVWELARHSIAEELVVYPAMEKHVTPGGKEMAEKDRQEHQVVLSLSTIQCQHILICV